MQSSGMISIHPWNPFESTVDLNYKIDHKNQVIEGVFWRNLQKNAGEISTQTWALSNEIRIYQILAIISCARHLVDSGFDMKFMERNLGKTCGRSINQLFNPVGISMKNWVNFHTAANIYSAMARVFAAANIFLSSRDLQTSDYQRYRSW